MEIKITDNSAKIKEEFESAIEKGLYKCGLTAQEYAKQTLTANGNVDTGRLRASVAFGLGGETPAPAQYTGDHGEEGGTYDGVLPEDAEGVRTVYIGTNVEYAEKIECGSSISRAYPYLEPAAANHSDEYKSIIKEFLGSAG